MIMWKAFWKYYSKEAICTLDYSEVSLDHASRLPDFYRPKCWDHSHCLTENKHRCIQNLKEKQTLLKKVQLRGNLYHHTAHLLIFLHTLDTKRTFWPVKEEENFQVKTFDKKEMERSFSVVPSLQLSLAVYMLDRDERQRSNHWK